jgi:uncharacterized protein (DUF302 family)
MIDDYTIPTEKNFDKAVNSVLEVIKKKGLRVLHIHDISKMLASAGFSIEPLSIVEFCSEKFASELLHTDVKISLIMPCKINVYVKDGKTYISTLRPRAIGDFYSDLMYAVEQEDALNLSIVDEAKGL